MVEVKRFVNNPVTSNCYVLYDDGIGNDCIIVDPGCRDETELLTFFEDKGLSPQYIILTHEHFDHCWGVNQLVEKYNIPIICSQLCAEAIKYEKRNCSVFYDNKEAFTIDCETISIESLENTLSFLGHDIQFFNTPGHTGASISFVVEHYLFTGDTLIKDEKTVTKLPTGSKDRLKESLAIYTRTKGIDLTVCSGHGEGFELDRYDLNKAL